MEQQHVTQKNDAGTQQKNILKDFIRRNKITQAQASRLLGKSTAEISRLVNGYRPIPKDVKKTIDIFLMLSPEWKHYFLQKARKEFCLKCPNVL